MYCQPVGRVALHHVGRHVGPQNAITVVDVETGLNTDFEIKVPYRRTESTADVTWGRAMDHEQHGVGRVLFAKPHAGRARAGSGGPAAPELVSRISSSPTYSGRGIPPFCCSSPVSTLSSFVSLLSGPIACDASPDATFKLR
jgi:hypothetical protein